jgi:DNA polymerase
MGESEALSILNEVRDEALSGHVRQNIKHIHAAVSNCRKCDNVQADNKIAVFNTTDPKAVIVLERPNIGPEASAILMDSLSAAGFTKSDIGLTYLNRCYPKNSKVTSEQTQNCQNYLDDELLAMNPKVIIACGKNVAINLVGPIDKVSQARGSFFWSGSYAVLVTFSPSYIQAQPQAASMKKTFIADLTSAYNHCYLKDTTND